MRLGKPNIKLIMIMLIFTTLAMFPLLSPELFYVDFLLLLFMYATIAAGWNIIGGYTGYYSFGHTAFFGLGAYTTAVLVTKLGMSPFLTFPLCGLVAAGFAFIIGYPTLRLKGAYFAIATLSLSFALQILALNLTPITGGGEGLTLPLPPWSIRVTVTIIYYIMYAVFIATILATYLLERSRIGLALKCIRDNELAAESIGIPTTRMKFIAFLLSAFFPGIAGGVFAYYATYIDPPTFFNPSISMFAIVFSMFGGAGTVLGPVVGTAILFTIDQIARYTITVPGFDLMIFSIIAIAIILFMPKGIVGVLRGRIQVRFSRGEIHATTEG